MNETSWAGVPPATLGISTLIGSTWNTDASTTPVSGPDTSVGVFAAASKPGAADVGALMRQRQAP